MWFHPRLDRKIYGGSTSASLDPGGKLAGCIEIEQLAAGTAVLQGSSSVQGGEGAGEHLLRIEASVHGDIQDAATGGHQFTGSPGQTLIANKFLDRKTSLS